MAGNTRPDWVDGNDPDTLDGSDPAIMADIEAAMRARGYTEPAAAPPNGQQAGPTPPVSNTAPDPGTQSEGADAGVPGSTSANAPVVPPPGGGAVAPTGDTPPAPTGQELPPPAAGTEAPPPEPAGPLTIILPSGDPLLVDQAQANYLVQLHNWLESKPAELKETWRQIEDGTHKAITAEDFTAYQAWVQAGRPTATQPAPQRPQFDTSFVNQEFLDYVAKLEGQVKEAGVPHSQVPPPPPVPGTQMTEADMQARATALANRQVQAQQAMDQSLAAMREKYSLSPEQVAHLQRVTPTLNIIPAIADKHRNRDPFGGVLSEAPLGTVFTEAFETAMTLDPTLRSAYEDRIFNERMASEQATRSAVETKKGLAGSVATAPSAAVPGTQLDPSKMTPQQRHEAMVAELTEVWGTGQ